MNKHEKINYLEFASSDLALTKAFFSDVFGWQFEDYGSNYMAFNAKQSGLDGGFYRADLCSSSQNGAALVVFYTEDIEATQAKVLAAKGEIVKPIFEFPGGRRFHFTEPCGNEFAAWTDQ